MDECIANHQLLLPENYIVQPVENVPVSIIDYDKLEMAHLIHPGQLTNGTPVIQLADINSNEKSKVLHPLEMEIQRDFELKQRQEALSKHQTSSVIQSACSQTVPDATVDKIPKCIETSNSLFNTVMQIQTVPNRKDVIPNNNIIKSPENPFCQISSLNRQVVLEKRQYIIVPDNSVFLNVERKESKNQTKNLVDGEIDNYEIIKKPESPNVSNLIDESKINSRELILESDSETEEDDIEPVYDYEPDPDTSSIVKNVEQNEKPNKCYMCFKSFRQKKNMYAHIRKIHSIQPKIEGGILCPLCKMHALRQEHLRTHLETLHEIPIEKEEKLFNTMEEFLSWKECTERETLSFYVSKSSSKLLANNQQKTYYKCHRSGHYITLKKENRKKKLKMQGSNKIGATCPAAIEVTENVHGINVTFWKTHVGHSNDLAHLVLSKEDKTKILDYMSSGFSWDKILEIFKKEGNKTPTAPSKLTSVSKQDLRNLKKVHENKPSSEFFSPRRKIIQGRKPVKEKMLRRASQSLVIEKADLLLNLLETTDIKPEFRPKVCLMIDNLISTVKRRAVKNSKRENVSQRRKQWTRKNHSLVTGEREQNEKAVAISNLS